MKKFFRFLRSMPIYMGDVILAVLSFFGSHFVLKFAILFIMQAVNPIQNGHIRDLPLILDVALVIFSVAISTGVVLIWHKGEHGWKKQPDKQSDNASNIYSEDSESNDIQYQKKEDISPIYPKASDSIRFEKSEYFQTSASAISTLNDFELMTIMRHYHVVEEIRTKVRGVTFRNNDGTDRQTIIRRCHTGDQLRFGFYRYKGDPAYTVTSEHGQLGNVSAELAEELYFLTSRLKNKHLILGEILNVSGGYHGESLGCNISITIYEKNY